MHLGKRGKKIEDIQKDFGDGILLINLLEIIGGEDVAKYNRNPTLRIHKIENLNKALEYIRRKNVKLHGISSEEITDENLKLILGMIWTVILRFAIADISEEELSAKEALLLWCKKKTAGYNGVNVENFTTSWKDGLALAALIHAHRPDLIPFDSLTSADPRANLKLAFDVAEKEFGIPPLIDIEDIVDVPKPDERSVMTYISQFYHYFSQNRKQEIAGRRIGKLVDMTRTNDELKSDYNLRSADHIAWVNKTTGELSDIQLDNTLEGVQKLIADLNTFKQDEKPPKIADRLALETLHNAIQIKLNAANRPPYVPPAGQGMGDIANAWDNLENAQQARENALYAELARQQKLDLLKRKFNAKATQLEEWIQEKEDYLKSPEVVDSVGAAQSQLKTLDAFLAEYEKGKQRLESLLNLRDEIVNEKDRDSQKISDRADKIKNDFENLKVLASNKKSELESKQKDQEDKEDLRKRFANAAKEYNYWVKDNITQIAGTVFPDNLEALENSKTGLDSNDQEITSTNDEKKKHLDDLWDEEQAKGIVDNRYTVFTNKDIASLHQQVGEALARRREEYNLELERQRINEEKRKLFAKLAQEFVDHIEGRKQSANDIAKQGEPDAAIASVKQFYEEGKPELNQLSAIVALQDELGSRGISDNKYTKYTLPILKVYLSQYVRHIRNIINTLNEEETLKAKYNKDAAELAKWISETIPTIGGEFDNTLESVRVTKRNWNEYKTTVKAERAINKINIQTLYNKINHIQEVNNRPAFNPAAGTSVEDLNQSWTKLEEVVKARDVAISEELARQEKLYALAKAFNNEAEELENWAQEQKQYLVSEESIGTLDDARIKITHLDVFEEDYTTSLGRLQHAKSQKEEILSLNYVKSNEIASRYAALEATWEELKNLSASKRGVLENHRSSQQEKEDLRIDFAEKAEDYVKFVKNLVAQLDDLNFGTTLEDVQQYKEKLAKEDEDSIEINKEKRAGIALVAKKLEDAGVSDNRHSQYTMESIVAAEDTLTEAMIKRREAYVAALQQEVEFDEYRRQFAQKADEFVAFVQKQREDIKAAANTGSLDERTDAVKAIHQAGEPNQKLLDYLVEFNKLLQSKGIFNNQYCPHTVPSLEKLNKSLNDGVENLLQFIAEDKEFEARAEVQAKERQEKEQLEQQKLEFEKQGQDFVLFLDTTNESLTEPVNVNSIEAVDKLIEQYEASNTTLDSRQSDLNALVSKADELKQKGLDVSADTFVTKYNESKKNAAHLKEQLDAELLKQTNHDNLRKQFAEKATILDNYLNQTAAKAAQSSGSLESQLALLNEINVAEGKSLYEDLAKVGALLFNENIVDNKYTEHNLPNIKARLDETESSLKAKQSLLEKEILSKKHSAASPEQIEEFKEVFRHFDKNGTNKLSKLEFKSCLQSLGEDPTDDDMERLLQSIGTKQDGDEKLAVEFDAFVEYMIKATSDTTTQNEITQAFKDLAHDKDFVTVTDLQRGGMSPDRIAYLVANMPPYPGVEEAYDYNADRKSVV